MSSWKYVSKESIVLARRDGVRNSDTRLHASASCVAFPHVFRFSFGCCSLLPVCHTILPDRRASSVLLLHQYILMSSWSFLVLIPFSLSSILHLSLWRTRSVCWDSLPLEHLPMSPRFYFCSLLFSPIASFFTACSFESLSAPVVRFGPRLFDVHLSVKNNRLQGGDLHLVDGSYAYFHYMQDRFNDKVIALHWI